MRVTVKYLSIGFCVLLLFLAKTSAGQSPAQQLRRLNSATEPQKIRIYLALSHYYERTQPDSAVFYANEGVRLAEANNDKEALADLLLQMGEVNALHHHHELARQFYNEALGVFRRLHDAGGIARSYDALGALDNNNADFSQAMQYYRDSRDSNGIMATYTAMGHASEEKGEHDKALSYYLRALTQYEHRQHRPEAYFSLLETIGHLYEKKGDTKRALHYFREGVQDSIKQGDTEVTAHLLNAEGDVLAQRKDEKGALTTFKQALNDARKYHQPEEQAEALLHIADILKKSNVKGSITDLKQALDIARGLHEAKLEARIYAALAGVYQQQKDYNEAILALEEQHRLVDSLLNADTVKDITALDSSYALQSSHEKVAQLEKINHYESLALWCGLGVLIIIGILLALLWRYLVKVRKLNAELAASNRVKDTLFSVIGHDLKGPASSAAQLFEFLEDGDVSEEEMRSVIAELRKQTGASLELLKSLLEWGKTQLQGIQVKTVEFDPKVVIDRCVRLLSRQAADKQISITEDVPEGLKVQADADHFEFVTRNLLANAIKFSFPGGDIRVSVVVRTQTKEIVVSVTDSGVGISKEQQSLFRTTNLNVSFGTAKEKGTGLGLLLAKDFIKANGGKIWLESEEGMGTTFYVSWLMV